MNNLCCKIQTCIAVHVHIRRTSGKMRSREWKVKTWKRPTSQAVGTTFRGWLTLTVREQMFADDSYLIYFSTKTFWQHTRIVSSTDDFSELPKDVFDDQFYVHKLKFRIEMCSKNMLTHVYVKRNTCSIPLMFNSCIYNMVMYWILKAPI